VLNAANIKSVYVVGLAMDFCVKATAIDAVKAGFQTFVVEEGTKAVDEEKGWPDAAQEMEKAGVQLVNMALVGLS
jgi:nicotinamidase-related amidase